MTSDGEIERPKWPWRRVALRLMFGKRERLSTFDRVVLTVGLWYFVICWLIKLSADGFLW